MFSERRKKEAFQYVCFVILLPYKNIFPINYLKMKLISKAKKRLIGETKSFSFYCYAFGGMFQLRMENFLRSNLKQISLEER
jgi:hypothetical protein